MSEQQAYIPGMCNINVAEIAYRRKAMIIGLLTASVLFIALLVFGVNAYIRSAVIFLPLLVGILNYLQVKNRFCVSYAASGKQNAADGSSSASDINDAESRATDKKKASRMNRQAVIASVVVVVLLWFVPSL